MTDYCMFGPKDLYNFSNHLVAIVLSLVSLKCFVNLLWKQSKMLTNKNLTFSPRLKQQLYTNDASLL